MMVSMMIVVRMVMTMIMVMMRSTEKQGADQIYG